MPYFFDRTAEWESSIGLLRSVRYFRTRSVLMPPSVSLPLAITMRKKMFYAAICFDANFLLFCLAAVSRPLSRTSLATSVLFVALTAPIQRTAESTTASSSHSLSAVWDAAVSRHPLGWPMCGGKPLHEKITGSAHLRCPSYRNNALYMCASWSVHIFSFTVISYGLLTTEVCLM